MTKLILHVWTLDRATPWIVERPDTGERWIRGNVTLNVPSWTRSEGHTPCANWYIECNGKVRDGPDGLVIE